MSLKRAVAAVGVALVLAAGFLLSKGTARDMAPEPITYADLMKRPVLGRLGHPLGEIVSIEGIFADGTFTKVKQDDGWILVRVRGVNGKALKDEQVFQYQMAAKGSPAAGAEFKFIGYETGGFTGIPNDAFKYTPPVATTGFGFTTEFVFLRDEKAAKQP